MSWADVRQAVADAQLTAFGDVAVFTPDGGEPVDVSVIFHEQTAVIGELGVLVDPRASAELPVAIVGLDPQGRLELLGRVWELGRPVKHGGPSARAHHWLMAVS